MKTIIDTQNNNGHTIEPYHFKVLGGTNVIAEEIIKVEDNIQENKIKEDIVAKPLVDTLPIVENTVKKEEPSNQFIEELLKKSDELSSNIIKLQMQIEKQEDEFNNRLKADVERESQEAYQKGYDKAKEELTNSLEEIKTKYLNSINILEQQEKSTDEYLKKIEMELSSTAVEIAKEVILKEVKIASSEIAISLSKNLLEELKDAKNIKLKVNPKDYESLKETYATIENIKVDSDVSITEGGVVILSDVGNLDGSLSVRLEKVKNLIQNG